MLKCSNQTSRKENLLSPAICVLETCTHKMECSHVVLNWYCFDTFCFTSCTISVVLLTTDMFCKYCSFCSQKITMSTVSFQSTSQCQHLCCEPLFCAMSDLILMSTICNSCDQFATVVSILFSL